MKHNKMLGKQSIEYSNPPVVLAGASTASKKEGEGPIGSFIDHIEEDFMFAQTTWEEAESEMIRRTVDSVIKKSGFTKDDIRFLVGGDLLGQLIATSFGIMTFDIPILGVYGACSTMAESIVIASMMIDGGFADKTLAVTSSHFAGAEKQFRFPLDFGNQRPLASTWTVTGCGAVVIGDSKLKENTEEELIYIKGVTIGKIVDYGVKDSMNMGACMAPAAYDTIRQHLQDYNRAPEYYDHIITGDLGKVGSTILVDLLKEDGYDISKLHLDCGLLIYDCDVQDTHSGGSGCGCSAITLTAYIFDKLRRREWKRILFVPTGALLSTVSYNEGKSVPGVAHGVILEVKDSER